MSKQVANLVKDIGRVRMLPLFFPVRQPAGIGLTAKRRNIGIVTMRLVEIRIAAAAVQSDGAAIEVAGFKHKIGGPVGGIKRDGNTLLLPQPAKILEVLPVIGITTVFIFYLYHQDRTAMVALQG